MKSRKNFTNQGKVSWKILLPKEVQAGNSLGIKAPKCIPEGHGHLRWFVSGDYNQW